MVSHESLLAETKEQFAFLFHDYNFNDVAFSNVGLRNRGGLLGLESPLVRLRVRRESPRVKATMEIGTLSSQFDSNDWVDGNQAWFPVITIISFLESRIAPLQVRSDVALGFRFEVLAGEVFNLFASQDMLPVWSNDYKRFFKGLEAHDSA